MNRRSRAPRSVGRALCLDLLVASLLPEGPTERRHTLLYPCQTAERHAQHETALPARTLPPIECNHQTYLVDLSVLLVPPSNRPKRRSLVAIRLLSRASRGRRCFSRLSLADTGCYCSLFHRCYCWLLLAVISRPLLPKKRSFARLGPLPSDFAVCADRRSAEADCASTIG